ncbi:hypothetical protein PIB30_005838 [Stylosanthes scabra]|uniref:Putative plant transposon protein domain-containing protein n=1 Tax=Stylosanthes scabra TaxID=79078 RepID=A0ABU6Z1X9_9FABA|nr:hypothetical protein [Stylosanthes scabra]
MSNLRTINKSARWKAPHHAHHHHLQPAPPTFITTTAAAAPSPSHSSSSSLLNSCLTFDLHSHPLPSSPSASPAVYNHAGDVVLPSSHQAQTPFSPSSFEAISSAIPPCICSSAGLRTPASPPPRIPATPATLFSPPPSKHQAFLGFSFKPAALLQSRCASRLFFPFCLRELRLRTPAPRFRTPTLPPPCASASSSASASKHNHPLFPLMVRKGKKSVVPNNPRLQSSDPNTFENSRAESNYTKIEDRHLNFERKIVLPDELKVLVEDKITHHGWTFLYEDPIPINVSIVREFYANYWSAVSDQVFLRGKKVSISHRAIETLLHFPANTLKGKDDYQKALDKNKKSNLDMNEVDTAILIWAIMKKKKVYIPYMIMESFRHVFTVDKYLLAVPSLIMKLATKAEVTPKLGDEIFNVTRKLGIIPYGNWAKQGGGGPTKKRKAAPSAPPP